jgi:hypothetical protein
LVLVLVAVATTPVRGCWGLACERHGPPEVAVCRRRRGTGALEGTTAGTTTTAAARGMAVGLHDGEGCRGRQLEVGGIIDAPRGRAAAHVTRAGRQLKRGGRHVDAADPTTQQVW